MLPRSSKKSISVRRAIPLNYDGKPMSLPPVFAASALYDNLLQAALRQFFSRATFETEADPVAVVRRPAGDRADQRSVGADDPLVRIAARAARAGAAPVHRARSAAGAGDRRGARRSATARSSIRGRCSSAASCSAARSRIATSARSSTTMAYTRSGADARRLVATAHRSAARRGAVELREPVDLVGRAAFSTATPIRITPRAATRRSGVPLYAGADRHQELLPAVRRPADACSWSTAPATCSTSSTSSGASNRPRLDVPCPTPYRPHALATAGNRNVCIVLSPSHEIKVFAEGVQVFSFRNARWHLLDLQAKYEMWAASVGNRRSPSGCSRRRSIWPTRAKARCSSCCAIPRRRCRCWSRPAISSTRRGSPATSTRRRAAQLLQMLQGRTATELDPAVLVGPGADRRRDGARSERTPARRRRHPAAHRARRAALEPRRRRRADDGGDGRRPVRRGAEGERGRADHVLRSAGTDLGYLRVRCRQSPSATS